VKFSLRDLFEGKPTRTAPHGAKREERKRRGSPYLRAISSRRKTALAACPPGPDVGPKRPNEGWTAVTGSVVIRRPERRSTGSRGDGGPAGCSAAPTRTRRGGPGPGSRGPVQQARGRGRWRGPGGSPRREPRKLVTTGFYARLRHPIYVFGTMAFLLVLLALQGWQALVIWAILIPIQVIRARREERVLTEAFGAEYEAYRKSTWF